MRLSAVIITFNEEENLARALASLQDVADEVVIVDSLSTDRTKQIAEGFDNVKFHSQPWLGYAAQKNFANSLASFDAILSIDADEALSEELRQSILSLKQEEDLDGRVFELARLTNYCGSWIRHCGWYPDKRVRLFDRRNSEWYGEFVHERLSMPQDAKIVLLKGDLLHYSYKSVSDHLQRIDRYTDLTSKEAFQKGKKASFFDLWLRPKWKFTRDFVFKLGLLDGYAGYQVCKLSATATFLKYAKLRQLNQDANTAK